MPKLTGYQRFKLKRAWIERKDLQEKFDDFEEFVKNVCSEKGIEYHRPPIHERDTVYTPKSTTTVFPAS